MLEYGLLKVSGADAKKFLQGQLTCDIETLQARHWQLGAHCNPQGRIISLFDLYFDNENYFLLMPLELLAIALAALKKYAVFFKADISEATQSKNDLILPPIGLTDLVTWHRHKIQAGIPTLYAGTSGMFLPHELNLHELGAVSFTKGCYTGQEIIARMQYRGKLKKHLYRVRFSHPTPPPPGTEVFYHTEQGDQTAGILVDSLPENSEKSAYNTLGLVMCDEVHTKEQHLYLDGTTKQYLTFLA